ncbi:hypothetical protein ES703_31993 [subsurface metagenome]
MSLRRRFLLLSVILLQLGILLLHAQADPNATAMQGGVIRGWVMDSDSGEPLAGANLIIDGTRLGAAAGLDGGYRITDVPPGTYRLNVKMIGYRVKIIRQIHVASDSITTVVITLEPQPIDLETVTVIRRRDKEMHEQVETSVSRLRIGEVESLVGAGSDLFRAIQLMPGVVARSDLSSQFYVRGGTPDQNLIIVDNVPVFNPYRLKMFGGPVSMFNPDNVESVELLPGGFPAEYGDKLSAVLVVHNKEGDRFDNHYSAGASLIDMKVFGEGPLPSVGEEGSWLFSARRTYYDLLLNKLEDIPRGTVFPFFQDYQGKIAYDLSPTQKLRINFTNSTEGLELKDLEPEGEDDFISEDSLFTIINKTDNNLFSVGWINAFSDVSLSNLTLSRYNDTRSFEVQAQADSQKIRSDIDMRKLEIKEDLTMIITRSHTLKAGFSVADYITDITMILTLDSTEYYQDNPDDRRPSDTLAYVERKFRFQNAATTTAYYLQDNWKILPPRLSVSVGLRADHSTFTGEWVYSPRLAFNFMLTPVLALRGGWGHFYQAPNFVSLYERFEQEIAWNIFETIQLKTERAIHYLAGLEWKPAPAYTAKVDWFYKDLDRLVMLTDSTEDYVPNNAGLGFVHGFEVFLKRDPAMETRLSGWASYSYSVAKEKGPLEVFHYRDFDQRHTMNTVVRVRPFGQWHIDSRFSYGSGFPWTPVKQDSLGNPIFDDDGVVWGTENSERYPFYSRWDLRLSWNHRFFGRLPFEFYIEIINLQGRKNVYNYYWRNDYRTRYASYMLPRMPFFGIKFGP